MQRDMLFWIWLSEVLGQASREFRPLISLYENPYDIFHAEEGELDRLTSLSERTRKRLSEHDLERATEILSACERLGIGILAYSDPRYPNTLRQIDRPPILLYYRGKLPEFDKQLGIGVVGTRKISAYGLRSAYRFSYELAIANVLVVSGMATGVDGVSAAAALAAGGSTVAILGCGVDVVYPKHHQNLMNAIAQNGVILSEYPPGTRPSSYHFPTRNRLISGISHGTLVVEAGIGSGSLITAKEAILQGREVFAVPANVGSEGAEGTNGLLRDGATLVLHTKDVIAPFEYVFSKSLNTAKILAVGNRSQPDLEYLDRLGVIQYTPKRAQSSEAPSTREEESKTTEPREGIPKQKTKAARQKPAARKASPPAEVFAPSSAEVEPPRSTATDAVADRAQEKKKSPTPDQTLASLSEVQRAVLEAMPDDRATTADALAKLDFSYGEIIAALTMLEILGLIEKLPGALYIKT